MSGTIICYGDSNTYGYDPCVMAGDRYPEEDRWTGILERETDSVHSSLVKKCLIQQEASLHLQA